MPGADAEAKDLNAETHHRHCFRVLSGRRLRVPQRSAAKPRCGWWKIRRRAEMSSIPDHRSAKCVKRPPTTRRTPISPMTMPAGSMIMVTPRGKADLASAQSRLQRWPRAFGKPEAVDNPARCNRGEPYITLVIRLNLSGGPLTAAGRSSSSKHPGPFSMITASRSRPSP
mgnify:CR=1 FL=1